MSDAVEQRTALVALATIPDIGARRLASIVSNWRAGLVTPQEVVATLGSRPHPCLDVPSGTAAGWDRRLSESPPDVLAGRLREGGVGVTIVGEADHPSDVVDDPHIPPVLFWAGDRRLGSRPRVGIVGTRRASRYGLDVATGLGRDLSNLGVAVVSGLALGVDAAAHRGCLGGECPSPIAVVGCGVDVVYPRRHRELRNEVALRGAVISEYPPGTPPAPWRFPARNRVLAALCDALVVVESAETGGSLITAGHAAERGVAVLAVPGSVHSRMSVGCNRLLADGAVPLLDVRDVLDAIGCDVATMGRRSGSDPSAGAEASRGHAPRGLSDGERSVWESIGDEASSLDDIARGCGLPMAAVMAAVSTLEARRLLWVDEVSVQRRHDVDDRYG